MNTLAKMFIAALLCCISAPLAGCVAEQPQTVCVKGTTYVTTSASMKAGITIALDRAGRTIPC